MSNKTSSTDIKEKIAKLRLAYRRTRYAEEQKKRAQRTHKLCQVSGYLFRGVDDLDRAYTAVKDNDASSFAELAQRLIQEIIRKGAP